MTPVEIARKSNEQGLIDLLEAAEKKTEFALLK
jgi:hypothetical protein